MSLNKKIVILILALSLMLNSVFLLPSKAVAAVGLNVTCMSGAGFVVGVGALGPCSSAALDVSLEAKRTAKEAIVFGWEKFTNYLVNQLWPSLRDMIAKRLMDYIINETVKWIQGGGKPKFIGNWEGFVKDVGDIAFDSVMRETRLAKLCTPFGLNIQIGLLPVEDFSQRITCTLDKVVSNIQNFYVDFSVGGWRGYNLLWQPENNYYGVAINIADEVMNRVSKKSEAAKSEGLAGSGFMGDKICKAGSGKTKEIVDKTELEYGYGEISEVYGSEAYEYESGLLGDAMDSEEGKACESTYDTCVASAESESKKESCFSTYEGCMYKAATHTDIGKAVAKDEGYAADRSGEYCDPKDMVDATPGSMIGKAVGESITSDSKWAANIQSWVSALVNAVINRVIKEGVGMMQESLGGDKKDSYYPEEYKSLVIEAFEEDKQQMYDEISKFTDEWEYLLNSKNQSFSYVSSTLAILQQSQQQLQQLQQLQLTQIYLPSACEPAVTVQDIQSVQDEINRLTAEMQGLTGETQGLQAKLDEASSTINKIETADFSDEFQRISAQTAYQDFIRQYGTTAQLEAIFSGSDRQAADAEAQNKQTEMQTKQTELNNIQTRLSACQAAL